MIRHALFGCLLAFAATAHAAETAQTCTLKLLTSLPIEPTEHGLMTVPATLNDKPFHMLVDTGDYFSVITSRTAKVLDKKPMYADNMLLQGWGGQLINQFVNLDEFGFGRLKRGKTQFMVMKSAGQEFDGLLGADFLYYFDLDFDFAKGKLNLISPERCKGQAVYWTRGDYGSIPFDYKERSINLTVVLDGKEVNAIIDTGASDTVMSFEKATDLFDWGDKAAEHANARYPFKTMSFGGVTVTNPAVLLVPDSRSVLMKSGQPRMIIGMGVLRRLHLFISYKEEMIYVTPATQY